MTDKIRVGFGGDFQVKEIVVAPGDQPCPGIVPGKYSILGSRVPRGRRKGQGDGRGEVLDRHAPAGNALRPDPAVPPRGRHRDLGRPLRRATDAGRARGPPARRAGRRGPASPGRRSRPSPPRRPTRPTTPLRRDRGRVRRRCPFVVGIDAARKPDAPLVFEGKADTRGVRRRRSSPARRTSPATGNVLGPRSSGKGDVEAGFRKSRSGRRRGRDVPGRRSRPTPPRDPRRRRSTGTAISSPCTRPPRRSSRCARGSPRR